MKKELPKKCLTCDFMDFVDDELEELHCFHPEMCRVEKVEQSHGFRVDDNALCCFYVTSEAVKVDAKSGCW